MVEQALEPMRAEITKISPEVDVICKQRDTLVKDFDSYRRRLKALEAKRDAAQAKEKKDDKAIQDAVNEVTRYEAKVDTSRMGYNDSNQLAKESIEAARSTHDELIDSLLITTVVCQAELFARCWVLQLYCFNLIFKILSQPVT